jgi:CRISPR/Cas system CMR subunit Cmr6 (Cas7 group RAMP superfamily)
MAEMWAAAGAKVQHPVYPLLRAVRWHDGWKYDAPRDSPGPGVKAAAFKQAEHLFSSQDMKTLAQAVRERRAAWVEPLVREGRARRLVLRATTDFVLHLSSPGPLELGMAIHWVYGFPFLPATALKGLAHAVARTHSESSAQDLYGHQESAGRVAILDALPISFTVRRDVMTPHFARWYQGSDGVKPDDTHDPTPIPFLSVAAGSEFEIALIARARSTAATDLEAAENHLRQGCEERGLGAKTSAGYGAFSVETFVTPPAGAGVGGAQPAPGRRGETPPREPGSTARSPRVVEMLIEQVKALPANRVAGEIGKFVDECLKLEGEEDQKALAQAIVDKMTVREIRKRIKEGKRSEQWQRILALAGPTGA